MVEKRNTGDQDRKPTDSVAGQVGKVGVDQVRGKAHQSYEEVLAAATRVAEAALGRKELMQKKFLELIKARHLGTGLVDVFELSTDASNVKHGALHATKNPSGKEDIKLGTAVLGKRTVLEFVSRAQEDGSRTVDVTDLTAYEVAQEAFTGYLNFGEVKTDKGTLRAVAQLGGEDLRNRFTATIPDGGSVIIGRRHDGTDQSDMAPIIGDDNGVSRRQMEVTFLTRTAGPAGLALT